MQVISLWWSASISDYGVKSFRGSWKTCLRLVRRGGDAGERGDEPLVYADAPQEDAFVQKLVVVVQQDRRAVYGGKPNSRYTDLKAVIEPITRLQTGGMQSEQCLLTALIKRLSVAAGKISFSRVKFLQLENIKRLVCCRDLTQKRRLWIYDGRRLLNMLGFCCLTSVDLHFPASSTEGPPPRVRLLCWSHVLVHVFLQRSGTVSVWRFTQMGHLWVPKNWPEQIHRWHLHLLLCTRLWSVVQTPGGITTNYRWAQV